MNTRTTQLLTTLLKDVPLGRWLLVLSTVLAACASGASVALMGVSAWLLLSLIHISEPTRLMCLSRMPSSA